MPNGLYCIYSTLQLQYKSIKQIMAAKKYFLNINKGERKIAETDKGHLGNHKKEMYIFFPQ